MAGEGKGLLGCFFFAAVVFVTSLALGMSVSPDVSAEALEEVGEFLGSLGGLSSLGLFLIIFLNNAVKALGVVIFGIFFGLVPLFFILFNGFILGVLVSALESEAGYGLIAASLVPHGVVEVPILLLATALGLAVGWQSLRWFAGRESAVRSWLGQGLRTYFRWVMPGLLLAAAIEAFITPHVMRLVAGEPVCVGLTCLVNF